MLTDGEGKAISQWNFERAWPCKWDGPAFTSSSSQLAIETLEIAYERLKRIK
jgi:phage tail-like protein